MVGSGRVKTQYDPSNVWEDLNLVIANPGRILKKLVSGFNFKKPGYPGQVLGFQKCTKLAFFDQKMLNTCVFSQNRHFLYDSDS